METKTREKEAETWADFIKEFLGEGGVVFTKDTDKRGK